MLTQQIIGENLNVSTRLLAELLKNLLSSPTYQALIHQFFNFNHKRSLQYFALNPA